MALQKKLLGVVISATFALIPSLVYAQGYGTVATGTLNVRESATTESRILQQVGLGVPVEIVSEQNDWLQLVLKDGSIAYVKKEYIDVHRVVATVEVSGGLNLRDYPSTETGEIIGKFYHGDEISVHYKVGDWYKISQEGSEGFVHTDFVKEDLLKCLSTKELSEQKKVIVTLQQLNAPAQQQSPKQDTKKNTTQNTTPNTTPKQDTNASQSSGTGDSIVAYAKQFLGNRYVYGGTSLTNGTDCSGFSQQIMRNFGISIQRSSSAQYASSGYKVSADELQKGDLLFYGYKGRVSHVAIYIGGGQVIHANDERTGIIISSAFKSSGKPFIGAKRVI